MNVEINAPPALAGDGGAGHELERPPASSAVSARAIHIRRTTISPNPNSYWTQVGVRERDQRSLFGMFGLDLLRNRAHARVELQPALAGKGFLPVAIPEQDIRQAQIRYYQLLRSRQRRSAMTKVAETARQPATRPSAGHDALGPTDRQRHGRTADGRPASHAGRRRPAAAMRAVHPDRRRGAGRRRRSERHRHRHCDVRAARGGSGFADCWSRRVEHPRLQGQPDRRSHGSRKRSSAAVATRCAPDAYFAVTAAATNVHVQRAS